jgi:MarR family transcriptional regulator, organic hydroperoxide resistance regulator
MAKPARADALATQAILRHWREAVPDDRLAHLVKDATRALVRALQSRLVEHGVSFGHWTFLRILWEHDGLTQRELSREAGVMEPTTFSALQALERLGYIERRQLPDNRKNVYVHLTAKGRALRRKLVPLAEEVNQVAVAGMAAEDVARTRAILLAIIENLARDEERHGDNGRRLPSTRELGERVARASAPRRRGAR